MNITISNGMKIPLARGNALIDSGHHDDDGYKPYAEHRAEDATGTMSMETPACGSIFKKSSMKKVASSSPQVLVMENQQYMAAHAIIAA